MNPISLGVIGLGRMGRIYCAHLAHHAGARLGAVSSRRLAALSEITARSPQTRTYTDFRDLVADPDIQGVIVASHTHTHREIVIAAAAAGKAIFCEKPVALTLADTDAMLAAVEKAGVLFQVGFMRRFDKGFAAAKQQIEAGHIGDPVVASSVSRDPGCPDPEWAHPAASGGMLLDLAIHDFDLLRWLMNREVQRVYTEAHLLTCPDLAQVGDVDNAVVSLRFENGALGYVEACRNAGYGYDIRCEIRGTQGTIQAGYLRDTPIVTLTRQGACHDIVAWFEERFTPAYRAQIDHFIDCIRTDQAPLVGPRDARIALQISLAATQSWQESRPIEIAHARDLTGRI